MTQKRILLWPSHEPLQYIKVADLIAKKNSNIDITLFFLKKPNIKISHSFITFEDLIDSCNLSEIELQNIIQLNINELLLTDRIHKSGQNTRLILLKFIYSLKEFLVDKKIEIIFGYAVSDSITYGCYRLCESLGIPYYFLIGSKIKDYFYISSNLNGYPEESSIQSLTIDKAKTVIKQVTEDKISPQYASDKSMLANKSIFQSFKSMSSLLIERLRQKNKYLDVEMSLKTAFLKKITQQISFRELNNLSSSFDGLGNERFIYFPLHLHPETATLIWGRWGHNQLELIKQISRVIPNDCYIYVKEHKVAAGRHKIGFYKEISKLPNVKIIEMNTNSFDIIEESSAVATISGTAGFEAICQNKKGLLFGDADYVNLPNVIKCYDCSELRLNIKQALLPSDSDIFENQSFLEYVQKKLNASIILNNYNATSIDDELISNLSMLFEEKIYS